jgi:hypothetical protein
MDPFIKKLLKIIAIKIIAITIIFYMFFNEPSLSTDPQLKKQQIQTHFLNTSEKAHD